MSEKLRRYIKRRLAETNMSGRAAATAMGISQPYFARVASGGVERPGPEFCIKLAELFGDSHITVMRLAGWVPETETDEALMQEMHELAKTDPHFKDLLDAYRDITSEEQKAAFVAIAKAALEAYKKE